MDKIVITTEYIKLGQFLKFASIISSGATAKDFLMTTEVKINGIIEDRRGRKLYKDDIVEINKHKYIVSVD